jgi:hypothetical protein
MRVAFSPVLVPRLLLAARQTPVAAVVLRAAVEEAVVAHERAVWHSSEEAAGWVVPRERDFEAVSSVAMEVVVEVGEVEAALKKTNPIHYQPRIVAVKTIGIAANPTVASLHSQVAVAALLRLSTAKSTLAEAAAIPMHSPLVELYQSWMVGVNSNHHQQL